MELLYEPTPIREYEDAEETNNTCSVKCKYKCTVWQDDEIIRRYASADPPGVFYCYMNGVSMGRINREHPSLPVPPPDDVFVVLLRHKGSCSPFGSDFPMFGDANKYSGFNRFECFWIKKNWLLDDAAGSGSGRGSVAKIITAFDFYFTKEQANGMVNDMIEFARKIEQSNLKYGGHKGVSFVYDIRVHRLYYTPNQIMRMIEEKVISPGADDYDDDDVTDMLKRLY